jgi:uncharacterized protein YbjT (DUF2867 family)
MGKERLKPELRVAVVAGATGLVGSELVRRLLAETGYRRVFAIARRPLALSHPRLVLIDANFEQLDPALAAATSDEAVIDVFCCLGTTIGVAGS